MRARLCRSATGRALAGVALGGAAVLVLAGCTTTPTPAPSTSTPSVDPTVPAPTVTVVAPSPVVTPTSTPTPTPSPTATVAAPTKKQVSPFITSAVWDAKHSALEVSAIVSNIVEQDGTCTLTATHAGVSRTIGAGAGASAQSTGCQPLVLPGSQLVAGTWSVTVRYSSATSAGVSSARQVQVTK